MKKALLSAIAMLVLSLTLLVGTTFAWFSETVTSKGNAIKFGTFDMVLEIRDADAPEGHKDAEWVTMAGKYAIVEQFRNIDNVAVQPGMVLTKEVKVVNNGSIDFAVTYNLRNNDELGTLKVEYDGKPLYAGQSVLVRAGLDHNQNKIEGQEDVILTITYTVNPNIELTDLANFEATAKGWINTFEMDFTANQLAVARNVVNP